MARLEALGELVLKPAGLAETGYKAPRWAAARVAHGYRDGEDWGTILARIDQPGAPYWALRGNGGLHTTLADMVRWHAALQGGAFLTAASRESFFRPRVAEGPGPGLRQAALRGRTLARDRLRPFAGSGLEVVGRLQ